MTEQERNDIMERYYAEKAAKRTPEAIQRAYDELETVLANSGGRREQQDFINAFLNSHNTLQQDMGRMFIRALLQLAEQTKDGHWMDGRNEYLVRQARVIRDALGEEGSYI